MRRITRRATIKTIGGISVGSFIPMTGWGASDDAKNSFKNIKTINADILVVGGGTAGVIAAIQAARAGCSTILIENGSQLGGTITTGGVAFPGLFHAWGKQVICGIGWELVADSVRLNDDKLPDFLIPFGRNGENQVLLNPYLYALLAEEKCLQAGVQLRYYETPVAAKFKDNSWEVETIGKGTHIKIICHQLIDCTGNAALTSLAGYDVLREKETQPGTLIFKIGGYDYGSLDLKIIRERYDEAVKKGSLVKEEFRNMIEHLLYCAGANIQHIAGADSSTSELNTITNIKGRTSLLNTLRFLRELPGCEKTKILSMQPETGVRETYRIDGVYQITGEDYISGKVFDDSVSYTFYGIDVHSYHPNNAVEDKTYKEMKEGTVPTIPLRALIPKNSQNFLVAGRCVSSDRWANGALRVQASCMGMGQAAGAAAALASKLKTSPLNVPINQIKSLIADHGGIVP
jgi:hypothetical protein